MILVKERVNLFVMNKNTDEYKDLMMFIRVKDPLFDFVVTPIDLNHIEDYEQDIAMVTSPNFLILLTMTHRTSVVIVTGDKILSDRDYSCLFKLTEVSAAEFAQSYKNHEFIVNKHRSGLDINSTVTINKIFGEEDNK